MTFVITTHALFVGEAGVRQKWHQPFRTLAVGIESLDQINIPALADGMLLVNKPEESMFMLQEVLP